MMINLNLDINPDDEKIRDFFYDIKNVEYYKNSNGLMEFYEECLLILKNKTYTDINLKDEKGNTYLHYVSKAKSWNWFMMLLEHGADPMIQNNDKRNAFQIQFDTANLWRMYPLRDTDSFNGDRWHNATKNYALNFKNFLFNNHLNDNMLVFKDIGSAIDFLKKANIDNDENRIKIVAISHHINIKDKFKWFDDNFNSPEHNSEFISKVLKVIPYINNEKKEYLEYLMTFIKKDLSHNQELIKMVKNVLWKPQQYGEDFSKELIAELVKKNFDMEIKEGVKPLSILDAIEESPELNSFYYDQILSKKTKTERKPVKM